MWPFLKRHYVEKATEPWSLSTPLLQLSKHDVWTIGNSVEGTLGLGETGSGKSSTTAREIALAFLRAGYGGIVFAVKNDEPSMWGSLCEETHRHKDLLNFGPNHNSRFNFLDFELQRKGEGAGLTENIAKTLLNIQEVSQRGSSQEGGQSRDPFWHDTKVQLARNCTDLLIWATGRVTVPDLYQLVLSAPTSKQQSESAEWQRTSFCYQCLTKASKASLTEDQRQDARHVADFFLAEWPEIADKTRGIIKSTFSSTIDVLNRGVVRKLFCTDTNVTPQVCEDGKIIVLDMPIAEFGQVGLICQGIWKHAFQRSIARRNVSTSPRPVFMFMDEAQYFVTSADMLFLSTCRSSRTATVMLSQNISNFHAVLGGTEKAKAETNSIFCNLVTKVFHANSDPATNNFASDVIGKTREFMTNSSSSRQDDFMNAFPDGAHPRQHSAGVTEAINHEVEPKVFTTLRKGGYAHNGQVDVIWFQSGRRFKSSGRTWMHATFVQRKPATSRA